MGATLVGIGGLGILLNAVVPLKSQPVLVSPPPATTGSATVTTPGLPATQVELR